MAGRTREIAFGFTCKFSPVVGKAQAYLETVRLAIANLEKTTDDKKALTIYKEEWNILNEIKELAKSVTINGKTKMLLNILKKCFAYLKKIGVFSKSHGICR